jgi:hypothetical protein
MLDIVDVFSHVGNMITDPFAAAGSVNQAGVVLYRRMFLFQLTADPADEIGIDLIDGVISMPYLDGSI